MKKLALLFVLGFLLFASGLVSVSANGECISENGYGDCDDYCEVIVDEPQEGNWYDPVTIRWHYNNETNCRPVEYALYYQYDNDNDGDACDGDAWLPIDNNLPPDAENENSYEWDVSEMDEGAYCVAANMDQLSGPDAGGVSGEWYLDLTPPEVDYNIYDGPYQECGEEDCDYYITQDTKIELTCDDQGDWQSGGDYAKYYRYSVNGGDWNPEEGWYEYDEPFNFEEDSRHTLEFYCVDEVGKESDVESAVLVVDTQEPEFEKTVYYPKVDGCDEEWEQCDWYVTQDTEICLSATDPEPHPVSDELRVYCDYTWWETDPYEKPSGMERDVLDENGCFTYNEDSYHELHCWTEDALGNTADFYEADIVDTEAPYTWFEILGPSYGEFPMWIDGVSRVELFARDSEPHPVGVESTYFRNELVDDNYCWGEYQEWETTSKDDESWMTYAEPFGMEESCHVVEYYSVDKLGNEEDVKFFFVFVDKTAPVTVKEVGEPSSSCNFLQSCEPEWNWSENSDLDEEQIPTQIDWKVTLETPITISCNDQGDHPSGVGDSENSGIWYRIVLDGKYDESDWQFAQTDELTLYFEEESEHMLDFYCVDNVGKTSEHDIELFKVEGESFYIPLNDKWNLISVPVNLLSSDVEEVFNDTPNLEGVWAYENGEWKVYVPEVGGNLDDIVPGHGYWVKTSGESSILIGGELFSEAETPSSFDLDKGWNLIGYYGVASPKSAYCSLFSLVDTSIGFPRWSALYGYDSGSQDFVPLGTEDDMNAGKGYWLEMDVEDSYSPSSSCWYD